MVQASMLRTNDWGIQLNVTSSIYIHAMCVCVCVLSIQALMQVTNPHARNTNGS